jgi:hypothetical protein
MMFLDKLPSFALGVGVSAWLILAGSAEATVFTHWNTTELQTSLDTVTVIAGGGNFDGFTCQTNEICVHWNDGAGTATPTVKRSLRLLTRTVVERQLRRGQHRNR